jgi:hypothetical protein
MTKKDTPALETTMTLAEAEAIASRVADRLEDKLNDDTLALFVLLLRWFAYRATNNERESVYSTTETEYSAAFPGVADVVAEGMQGSLERLRKGAAS